MEALPHENHWACGHRARGGDPGHGQFVCPVCHALSVFRLRAAPHAVLPDPPEPSPVVTKERAPVCRGGPRPMLHTYAQRVKLVLLHGSL